MTGDLALEPGHPVGVHQALGGRPVQQGNGFLHMSLGRFGVSQLHGPGGWPS